MSQGSFASSTGRLAFRKLFTEGKNYDKKSVPSRFKGTDAQRI